VNLDYLSLSIHPDTTIPPTMSSQTSERGEGTVVNEEVWRKSIGAEIFEARCPSCHHQC